MVEKSTSNELSELISRLSVDQRRYVVARMDYPNITEAAAALGMKRETIYKWPKDVERAVELFTADVVSGAKAIRSRALAKAMLVKVKGLDSDDETIRQKVATELIEWELGKAGQPVTVGNPDGTALIPAKDKEADERHDRALSSLADAIRESVSGAGAKKTSEVGATE